MFTLQCLVFGILLPFITAQFGEEYPPLCDEEAAIACEFEFLQCRLFSGPADDPETMCACGESFYGDCIRRAGCVMDQEFDKLGNNEIYLKKCVDHVVKFDCESTLMCSVNCASEGTINASTAQIMPINNYGDQHLRLRFCDQKLHVNQLEKFSTVVSLACSAMTDFLVCERWIPPFTFTTVSIPSTTTYMEIDYCDVNPDDPLDRFCHTTDPPPDRLYGSSVLFPSTFDVTQTAVSVCTTDDDCLGSFCDDTFRPRVCSPKTLFHVQNSGKFYLTVPFDISSQS